MNKLGKFVLEHISRGPCMCGECFNKNSIPSTNQPKGHTADVQFFKVVLKDNPSIADKEIIKNSLIRLIKNHKGEFNEINLFDGDEHSYIEIGGWIGDQQLALMLIGMGELLDIWNLITPEKLFPDLPDDLKILMAQNGLVAIQWPGYKV